MLLWRVLLIPRNILLVSDEENLVDIVFGDASHLPGLQYLGRQGGLSKDIGS